jgi:hypothetical protein
VDKLSDNHAMTDDYPTAAPVSRSGEFQGDLLD